MKGRQSTVSTSEIADHILALLNVITDSSGNDAQVHDPHGQSLVSNSTYNGSVAIPVQAQSSNCHSA